MADIRDAYVKKKKIKPKAKPIGNIRIIDDDVSMNDLMPDNITNTLEDDLYRNEPMVAEIIDERPEIIRQLEEYTTGKWKRVANDDDDIKIKVEPNDDYDEGSNRINRGDDEDMDFVRRKRPSKETSRRSGEQKGSDIKIKQEKKDDDEEEVDETQVRVRKPTAKELEKKTRQEERKQQYKEWGKGLVQRKQLEEKIESDLAEAEKPLARYKDDQDLDKLLRQQERTDDPMLKYLQRKDDGDDAENGEKLVEKKRYKGAAPANRYGILPGYRWDGVDRSNGFEKRYFESISNRKARDAEAYKWSVEDM